MRKTIYILIFTIINFQFSYTQIPPGFNYQSEIRDSNGEKLVNQPVYFKFNIHQDSQTSLPIFTEIHYTATDDLGQVSLVIGNGTATTGNFTDIDWSTGVYFLGIELDIGEGYTAMGNTQLFSVPYALYAENSGSTDNISNLSEVLSQGNSANNLQIKDLQNPSDDGDAVNLSFLENSLNNINEDLANIQEQISEIIDGNTDYTQISDVDGNSYPLIEIADEFWTSQNLRVKTYRDGTPIPYVEDPVEFENLTTGAWRYVENDPSTEEKYGLLYNFYAVNNPRGLAPEGSRIPTTLDLLHLYGFLGAVLGESNNTSLETFQSIITDDPDVIWTHSSGITVAGTNTTGFNLYPAGLFRGSQISTLFGYGSILWTSDFHTSVYPPSPYNTRINFTASGYTIGANLQALSWWASSVRLIKE